MEPREIDGRTFPIVRRGYDPEQVDAFLARVARAHRDALEAANASPPGIR